MHDTLCVAAVLLALCATPPAGAGVPTHVESVAHVGHVARAVIEHPARVASPGIDVQQQATDAWLGSDKFQHFGMSWAVTAYSFAAARAAGADPDASLQVAVPVAAVAGIGKEVYDRRRGGAFSMRDLVADALGIAAAYFLLREVR